MTRSHEIITQQQTSKTTTMMTMMSLPRAYRSRHSLPCRWTTTTFLYIYAILFVISTLTTTTTLVLAQVSVPSHTAHTTTTAAAAAASTTATPPPTTTTEDLRSIERETLLQGATADSVVVAILPDRSTSYANGVHNGLTVSAAKLNISLTIHDVGNYDQETSYKVLRQAIDTPSEQQPKIYIVWPIDLQSKRLIQILYQTHQVPILQINQIPSDDTEEWEWDHLLGYVGQCDRLRASNAGSMMVDAMNERQIEQPIVVALGYPITYGGFSIAEKAFRKAISNSTIQLVEILPLEWGSQNAYDQMVLILDGLIEQGIPLHGVYAMEDSILLGAFQAIEDRKKCQLKDTNDDRDHDGHDHDTTAWLEDITLVGTVCNGARSLLEDGSQYGTTVQSPYLEALLAMDTVNEFLTTGTLKKKVRFTPNPIVTGETMNSLLIPFLDELYVGDELCTWNLDYIPSTGLVDSTVPKDICDWAECLFVPDMLLYAGYAMVGMNYTLALLCAIVIIMFRNKRIMTLAQPPFLLLVIVGACIDTTSILFMSQDNQHHSSYSTMTQEELDISCFAWPWLLTLGQMMTTATLVAKIYRVKVVTNGGKSSPSSSSVSKTSRQVTSNKFRRVTVSARDVSGFILGGLLIDIIILIVWYTTDPFYWQIQVVQTDTRGHILSARGTCSSDGDYYWMYPSALLLLHFGVLIYANVLAYQTRLYHAISDSNMVAISLFNSIQLLLVATLMFSLSGDNVSIAYLVRSSYAFLSNLGVLSLVVVPKVYQCLFGNNDQGLGSGGSIHISGLHPTFNPSANYDGSGSGDGVTSRRCPSNDSLDLRGGSGSFVVRHSTVYDAGVSGSSFFNGSDSSLAFSLNNGLSESPMNCNNKNNKTTAVRRMSSDLDFIVEEDGEHHSCRPHPMTVMSSLDDTASPSSTSSIELRGDGESEGEEEPHSFPTATATSHGIIDGMIEEDQKEEEDAVANDHSHEYDSSSQTKAVENDTDKDELNEIKKQIMDDPALPLQEDQCLAVVLRSPSSPSLPSSPIRKSTTFRWMGEHEENNMKKIHPTTGDLTDSDLLSKDGCHSSAVLAASHNNKTFQRSRLDALLSDAEAAVSSPQYVK